MNQLRSDARRYRIVIRGERGRLLANFFLMQQLHDLAGHVISLQDLDHDNGQATALCERLAPGVM